MSAASTATPPARDAREAGWGQSLADGAPGIALPHIERARAGVAGWEPVHRLATAMTSEPVHAHPNDTGLFRGAPAVAYALHTAGHPAYRRALETLDRHIATLTQVRLHAAYCRLDTGLPGPAREYDLINGLTGLGAYLMHRHHDHRLLREILTYLVRLTGPIRVGTRTIPGWWATGSPDRRQSPRWQGGHAGFGMAHGIAGPLALLSTAMRRGVTVERHEDAIRAICDFLDRWQVGRGQEAWWPEMISRVELRAQTAAGVGPHRPSWCYGTPGIARAQQLAGIALGDTRRAHAAEQALTGCLTDERQLATVTDPGLCHGWAGLVHTAHHATADTTTGGDLAAAATAVTGRMRHHVREHGVPTDDGFLEGLAGMVLADTASDTLAPAVRSGWDACLLVG